jgi:hypothetical protein
LSWSLLFRRILRKMYRRAVGMPYGPTRIRQAGFSLCHRRDGRAGTTILQRVSACDDRTKALISDYGPAGAPGARATPPNPPEPQDRSTGLRAGGSSKQPPPSCRYRRTFPKTTGRPGAADAADDSAGAAVPARDYGPGRIRRMAMPEYTAASGLHDHQTFRERADE